MIQLWSLGWKLFIQSYCCFLPNWLQTFLWWWLDFGWWWWWWFSLNWKDIDEDAERGKGNCNDDDERKCISSSSSSFLILFLEKIFSQLSLSSPCKERSISLREWESLCVYFKEQDENRKMIMMIIITLITFIFNLIWFMLTFPFITLIIVTRFIWLTWLVIYHMKSFFFCPHN